MWILKLGGSLGTAPVLPQWLRTIADVGKGGIVLVPGGGGFADEVRRAQQQWHFSDLTAHNMAVLAMAQYGYQLCGMQPDLVPVTRIEDLSSALLAGQVPVWIPLEARRDVPDAHTNWDASSDTLALDLAIRLRAQGLVIVKSCPIRDCSLAELSASGVVDAGLARAAAAAHMPVFVIDCDASAGLSSLLARHDQSTHP